MDEKTDALVLRAVDYGENDKIVTLLTAHSGKIGAALKGVRKAGSKLSFAAQPFCFAEYVFAEKSGRRTVTAASLHDGFYAIRESIDAFYAGAAVAEAADKLVLEGMESGEFLIAAVKALRGISEGDIGGALLTYLLGVLALAGYPLRADEVCPFSGKRLSGRLRFDMSSGAFVAEEYGSGTPASEVTYRTIRAVMGLGAPPEDKKEGEKRALRLLYSYFLYQTDSELPSLAEYIRML